VFAKKGTQRYIQLRWAGDTTSFVNFDIEPGAGAVGTSDGTASGSIVDAGNGWYRCVAVNTTTTTLTQAAINFVTSTSAARNESATWAGTETVFLWGAQLEQRSAVTAYTPTTTQPITNYVPVLLSAANNVARFDHNPVTGESLGLLIEEQRTNLFERSEDFDNAYWSKFRLVLTQNVIAPDGTRTAWHIQNTTDSGQHMFRRALSITSGTTYTSSIYAKAAELTTITLGTSSGVVWPATTTVFNLASGTVSSGSGTITPVGNGWYRCSITATAASTASNQGPEFNSLISGAGDGYSGIYVWGAQFEAGAFPTSYIPTVASQVTRSADAASMTGANFSSWYRADEGSFFAEYRTPKTEGTAAVMETRTASSGGGVLMQFSVNGAARNRSILTGFNGAQAVPGSNAASANVLYKQTAAWATNDFANALNGGAPVVITGVPNPGALTSFSIGSQTSASANFFGGYIRKIAFYPKRLTNAELQALTQN
jgi:hypothetical protein